MVSRSKKFDLFHRFFFYFSPDYAIITSRYVPKSLKQEWERLRNICVKAILNFLDFAKNFLKGRAVITLWRKDIVN